MGLSRIYFSRFRKVKWDRFCHRVLTSIDSIPLGGVVSSVNKSSFILTIPRGSIGKVTGTFFKACFMKSIHIGKATALPV